MNRRPPKKSETLEVRLAHETKKALMHKAKTEGRSASEVVRAFIDSYLVEQPKEARSMFAIFSKPAAALGAASLAIIWAAISPAPLHAKPDLKAVFQAIDRDGNKAVSAEEFMGHTSNPAIQKLHEGDKDGGHKGMAAMHRQNTHAAHAKPSADKLRAHFAEIDSNSNGLVSFDEFQAFHDKMKASHGDH